MTRFDQSLVSVAAARPASRPALRWAGAAAVALALAACSSVDVNDPALVRAREAVSAAEGNPAVARYAPQELGSAREALRAAEVARAEGKGIEDVGHQSYLAQQRAATAEALAKNRSDEERLRTAAVDRERALREVRDQQVRSAQAQAEQERQRAQLAQQETRRIQEEQQRAQQQAQIDQARQQTEQARQQAEQAQQQAEQARQATAAEQQRSQQLQQQLSQLSAKQTERGMVVTLGDVLFDTGKSELRSGARRSIGRLATVLKQNPERRIAIEGFTDSQGSENMNIELSRRRAEAVRQALVEQGVEDNRIEIRPMGPSFPIATNDTPAGRQMNRRVEVVISDMQGQIRQR